MHRIEMLNDAVRHRRHEISELTAERFRSSVRAVIFGKSGRNPIIVGSCILLQVDELRYVVTAAHILDSLETHEIYISGAVGTEPVQIVGKVHMTAPPPKGRKHDKIDVAFWGLDQAAIEKLGAVSFIQSSRLSLNRAPLRNRVYLAMGYPASRNKRNVGNVNKSIKTALSKYTGELNCEPSVPRDYGVSGEKHLFLKYQKYSETDVGEKRKTFKPVGLSGGPLVDLGNFASPERYVDAAETVGYVAGMIIKRLDKHEVLVATRIGVIVDAIRAGRAL